MRDLVEINNVYFSDRSNVVFENLNFSFQSGKTYVCFGERKSGKTTFLKLISGLLFPISGKIKLNNINTSCRNMTITKSIFYLPQQNFQSSLSIKKFIVAYAKLYPKFNKNRFEMLLNDFSINRGIKDIGLLKEIEQKKIFLAYALSVNVKVILLDGLFHDMDEKSINQITDTLNRCITNDNCIIISATTTSNLQNLVHKKIYIKNRTITELSNDML